MGSFLFYERKLGDRQIAENRTERALFSIMNVCRDEALSPAQLIWISLALEALYESPKAQITKSLLNRILLLLDIPENAERTFKKNIREFYDIRSRFVHGEMDIAHPFSNTILDDRIWDYDAVIIKNTDFGLGIVISTLQKMIENNWKTVIFKEDFFGY